MKDLFNVKKMKLFSKTKKSNKKPQKGYAFVAFHFTELAYLFN